MMRFFSRFFSGNVQSDLISAAEEDRIKQLPRYTRSTTTLLNRKFDFVDSVTFLGSLTEIFRQEIYKLALQTREPVIIDCGANIGLATIYLKEKHPSAKIFSFEPDPNIFGCLKENLKNFGYPDVQAINAAVSHAEGSVNFILEGGHSGMIAENPQSRSEVVRAIRLKDFLNNFELIDFLKIDIEGHEVTVIPDIAEELKKVNFLFLEYHSFIHEPQKLGEILAVLKEAGFRYYLREAFPKPDPFIRREIFLQMDFLANIFCYRN